MIADVAREVCETLNANGFVLGLRSIEQGLDRRLCVNDDITTAGKPDNEVGTEKAVIIPA